MNSGTLRGWGVKKRTTPSRVPRRLAEATSIVGQDVPISTTADLTGLAINFVHDRAEFDVEVELFLPNVYGPTGALLYAHIATDAGVDVATTTYSVAGANYLNSMRSVHVIRTPGVYAFKGRMQVLLAGPGHNNLDVAAAISRIRATEVRRV